MKHFISFSVFNEIIPKFFYKIISIQLYFIYVSVNIFKPNTVRATVPPKTSNQLRSIRRV